MKACPHCGTNIPDKENKCPNCGTFYWEPGKDTPLFNGHEEEKNGCSVLFLIPLVVGLGVTAVLVLLGFISNLLIDFENNQMKIVWIGISSVLGYVIFRLLKKIKKKA
ncbi:MAG: zinc ribbon domain-containing protein [Candidatus Aminicenantes bacterium]|nr:zinc ribbon domain-containing protein [Candidatus Aminicenantes bacterium]